MSLHRKNRERLLVRLRNKKVSSGMIVLQGGESQTRHDTDHEPLFRQESFFAWAFGVAEPDFFGLIDIASGKTILLIPRLSEEYAIWLGKIYPPSHFQQYYEVEEVKYVDEIVQVLQSFDTKVIYVLKGKNTDSGNEFKPAKFAGIERFQVDENALFPEIVECRVIKTKDELDLLRYVNKMSSLAHIEVMKQIRPGMMEYEMESLFQHYIYSNGGIGFRKELDD